MANLYLIGSLRNRRIIEIGNLLRKAGHEVYDDWISPGEEADEKWQEYEKARGRTYIEALNGWHAHHVYTNDMEHLEKADAVVMVMPCGKSAFWELGWATAKGKATILLIEEEPERFDIMPCKTDFVCATVDEVVTALKIEGKVNESIEDYQLQFPDNWSLVYRPV